MLVDPAYRDRTFYLLAACAQTDRNFVYLTISADITPKQEKNPNNILGVYRNTQGGFGNWQSIFQYTDYSIRGTPSYVPNVETGWKEWELKSASDSPANGIAVCPTN